MKELVYRPQHKPEQELRNDFVIRLAEFDKVMNSIKSDQRDKPAQHIIIQGMRGMGKTTLMHRMLYQLKQDHREEGLIPVIFSEEQYSVRTLYKLWEHIAQYLDEHEEVYLGIWEEIEEEQQREDYSERCFEILENRIESYGHRLVLLIDNFGVMVDKFSKQEQQRLREILITFSGIKIIGGSAVILESFFRYDKPFFDFFKVIQLNQLSSDEVRTLLLRLAEKRESEKIKQIIEKQPGRLEALRILTGGVPRTIVILFEIFLDDRNGNSIDDLKHLLDDVTPLYKHRMDELPPQQQELVDKLALNWDGMSVAELSKKTRMESKAVSAQLNVLVKNGVVHAEKSAGKNKYYQLQERFFNIWYLMQHAPRGFRKKVIWLTRFLEVWCDHYQLAMIASDFSERLFSEEVNPEYVRTMTNALAAVNGLDLGMRDNLIAGASNYLRGKSSYYLNEFPLSSHEIAPKIREFVEKGQFNNAVDMVEKAFIPSILEDFYLGYIYDVWGKLGLAIKHYELSANAGAPSAMFNLGCIYHFTSDETLSQELLDRGDSESLNDAAWIGINIQLAEKYYLMAVAAGHTGAMNNLGRIYQFDLNQPIKAMEYYTLAIGQGDINAGVNLAMLSLFDNSQEMKKDSLKWVTNAMEENPLNHEYQYACAMVSIWVDDSASAVQIIKDIINQAEINNANILRLKDILVFALIKGLRNYIFRLFETEEYQLKDRFKVLYYALMTLMQDEYPNEIKKMGLELKEPVQRMVAEIKAMEEKYNS